ncbi:MAG: hydantoinase subunit beta [Gammaproteobacteria bacterium]|nr:MAG: hydantoinase subunit beta [Gammaproteobacteria bacterium]
MRIGVDVGGTNTDAALMNGDEVLASCKQPTTKNVSDGIIKAVTTVLNESGILPSEIQCVMIGTTHFTNAFVERKKLLEVGIVRICLPAAQGIPPLLDWPEDILTVIGSHRYIIQGGYQFDGRLNSPLDEQAVINCAKDLKTKGIKTVAITGLFSNVNGEMELRAEKLIRQELGNISTSLSHKVGRSGILERENATIMNACLADLSSHVVNAFRDALDQLDIKAPFFISQNDGTLMTADYVEKYPILTFASGPTNSMRGAAYLSGVKDALVADIGGTTTDIGMLANGFPRESSVTVDIGGVRTNFRMPDVLALGLGGGTVISSDENSHLKIGPQSVGYQLLEKSRVFGGDTLTTTDIAVAAGYADIGNKSKVVDLPSEVIEQAVGRIHQIVEEGIDRMKMSADPMPLILVGGGSVLINRKIEGVSEIIVPEHAGVANAIGAAIAQVAGEIDTVISYDKIGRDKAIEQAKLEAIEQAISLGAIKESIVFLDIDETPLAYAPDGAVRLRVKVAGDLNITAISAQ